ncbi:SUMF1/EgtB/PvdO family nonheme iron enzyme [Gimesia algae]|uniref:Serine/threonine-protein kinase pkn1 n=1 Tax=Gimesia algae TaxID=2527971 RepID=A0A517VHN1_9PLAN|nr:SUMF1/EgtB/PvdO family nonheme iron enzyme [Gimesia algae]QDT92515.1 Serine/threonine-protein kinase pkn1 [Gimesia algae]
MAKFDPYYKWLGIPPKDQPPNHYRLLGIDLFEEDPDVIEAAADRCMAFVQQCALGEHLKASQQILNELSAARVCLLVSERKEKYDTELRAKIKTSEPESAFTDSWSEELDDDKIYDQVIRNQDSSNLTPRRIRSRRKKITRPKARPFHTDPRFFWGSAGVIVLLLLAVTVSSLLPGQKATSEPLNQVASSDQSELNESVPEEPAELPTPSTGNEAPVTLPQSPEPEDQPEPVQEQKTELEPKIALQIVPTSNPKMKPKSAVPESPQLLIAPFNKLEVKNIRQEWSDYLKHDSTVTNSIGMNLILIPPGEFTMGSSYSPQELQKILLLGPTFPVSVLEDEFPPHQVQITKPFYMGSYEVTREEFNTLIKDSMNQGMIKGLERVNVNRFPAWRISWFDCVMFCNQLSEREKLPPYYSLKNTKRRSFRISTGTNSEKTISTIIEANVSINGGLGYRLPSEAEWEYACRAGTTSLFHFGSKVDTSKSNLTGIRRPALGKGMDSRLETRFETRVGSYRPNNFDLYDMHGNVGEWCEDWYEKDFYQQFDSQKAIDPLGKLDQSGTRVFRGATWVIHHSAFRNSHGPDSHANPIGFRVVRTLAAPNDSPGTPQPPDKTATHDLKFSVLSESTKQPLKQVMIQLLLNNKDNQSLLGSTTTDAQGLGQISIALPTNAKLENCLVKLTSSGIKWERKLADFPEESPHAFTIPLQDNAEYLNPEWIEQRLTSVGVDQIINEYSNSNSLDVQTVKKALQLSRHVLLDNPQAVREQLQARLISQKEPAFTLFQTLPDQQIQIRSSWPSFNQPGGPLIRTLAGHSSSISCLAVTPDGTRAISGSTDDTLIIWDLATKEKIRTLEGHSDNVRCVAITPDGSQVVSGSFDKTLKVWNLADGKLLRTLAGHSDKISCVALTPDGKKIISGDLGGTIKIWDFVSGSMIRTSSGNASTRLSSSIHCLVTTPDGKNAVSNAGFGLNLWNIASGKLIRTLSGHSGTIICVAISLDGKQLISGSIDRTVRVWDIVSGKLLWAFKASSDYPIMSVGMTKDGQHAISGSLGGTLTIWNLSNGKMSRRLIDQLGDIFCVAVTPDGKQVISGTYEGALKVCNLNIQSTAYPQNNIKHSNHVLTVALLTDGKHVFSVEKDNTLRVWSLENGTLVRTLKGPSDPTSTDFVSCLALMPDGKSAISSSTLSNDYTLKVWSLSDGRILQSLEGYSDLISCVAVTPDGQHAISGSKNNTLQLWDLSSGKLVRILSGHSDRISCVAVTPNGRMAVSGSSDETLRVWDLMGGGLIHTLEGHSDRINCLKITPDGQHLISGSSDSTAKVWDLSSGNLIRTLSGHSNDISCLSVSSNGNQIISGSNDRTLIIWDLSDGTKIRTYELDDIATDIAINPNDDFIIVGSRAGHVHNLALQGLDKTKTIISPSTTSKPSTPSKKKEKTPPVKKLVFWNEPPLPRSWRALSKSTQDKIESVHGVVDERFIWCLNLPLSSFLEMQTELKIANYLPQRIRPYKHKDAVYVAFVCVRDQHVWKLIANASAQDMMNENKKLQPGNWMPVEAAGYFDQEEKYTAVWIKDGPSKAYLDIGLTKTEHKSNFDKLTNQKWYISQQDIFYGDKKQLRFTNVWYPVPKSAPRWASWYGSLQEHKNKQGVYSFQTDVSIAAAESFSAKYGGCWIEHPDYVSLELNELSPEEHYKEATRLKNLGFRPQSIDAEEMEDKIISASVWYRPK